MTQQIIQFVETKEKVSFKLREDRYQYMPANGWAWLQRVCFWILKKLKCNPYDEVIKFERHVIDTQKVAEAIYKQNSSLFQMAHEEGKMILIGSEDFARLMCSDEMRSMVTFNIPYRNEQQFIGMTVTIVPWMRGILVMPKL